MAERGGEGVGGGDVPVPAVDVGGGERPAADEAADAVADLLRPAGALAAGAGRLGELEQVGGGVLVELQRPGDGQQHLVRRVPVAALLQADVVVGADPGEEGDLLAAQGPETAGD